MKQFLTSICLMCMLALGSLQSQTLKPSTTPLQDLQQTLLEQGKILKQALEQSQSNSKLLQSFNSQLTALGNSLKDLQAQVDSLTGENNSLKDSSNRLLASNSEQSNRVKDLQAEADKLTKDIQGMITQIQIQKEALDFDGKIIIGESVLLVAVIAYEALKFFKIIN